MKLAFPAIISFCLLTTSAVAQGISHKDASGFYAGFIAGSRHIDAKTDEAKSLSDDTPGITIGRSFDLGRNGLEGFVEGGVFRNSYRETSPFLLAGVTQHVADVGPGSVRLGAFTGVGYYKKLSVQLKDEYGIPNLDGFIPLAGIAAIYRVGRSEARVILVPADNIKAVTNLSFTYKF